MFTTAACRIAIVALLAVAGAARTSAQEPDRLERARAALPRAAAARLEAILKQATAKGLPSAALIDKTLEGEAKQAPPERILAVVQQLADNLDRARTLLLEGGAPGADDITAVADALRRGVPDHAVRTLRAKQPGRPLGLAVETLADLLQVGVPVDQAVAVLQAWADRGGKNADLRDLPAAVERMVRNGTLPAQAAQSLAAEMRGSGAASSGKGGKSDLAPGQNKGDRPPVSPGAGPPRGKQKPPPSKPPHPGHG
ncbi:MAG TPA: hypothetical protein VF832_21410 [Longimicrobiales bacterium]